MKPAVPQHNPVLDSFRRWGFLEANIDPFGILSSSAASLILEGEGSERARKFYCGSIGVEFMHIPDQDRCRWIQEQMESEPPAADRQSILEWLVKAEILEQVLHSRYPGTKRFSLEGLEALIPLLATVLEHSEMGGASEAVMGMSHRGRLNVMVNIVGKSPVEIFAGFEDVDPRSVLGAGDVKYHMGATGEYRTRSGKSVEVRLVSNPSHLEAVDPVALGRARAKQTRFGPGGSKAILPILIHGDAAFAGQGIAAESLNLAYIDGFSVGGTIHIIANNLLGFTAIPRELHSSRFATEVAKRLAIPIFHVNADDAEAVVRVARMAAGFRYAFDSSVVVDLIGFRRHGHSEVDDPTMTQPILYRKIREHPPLWKLYAGETAQDPEPVVAAARELFSRAQDEAGELDKIPRLSSLPDYWSGYAGGCYLRSYETSTAVAAEELAAVCKSLVTVPESFHIHPKVKRLFEQRAKMGKGELPVDFGLAELLAFGSLVSQGILVRLSGQDSKRGTFSQRHAVLIDTEDEQEYIPLQHVSPEQARFEVYSSILSEAAVMGFEYGFSRDYPDALILWEAQFGDFANGAQIIIDQFIAAGEDKWDLLSGLVLLLPHGYEGQGPEHSSARIERFLQLAAEDNMQVCQPSTSAQYFHLLRRQALRKWRKPLVIFTPKSMLRLADASSPIKDFTDSRFHTVLEDPDINNPDRVIMCTGKIGRELRAERLRRKDQTTAIVFLEQLYPFPKDELEAIMKRYPEARDVVWVQEEPANMGAFHYVMPKIHRIVGNTPLRSVKRSASAGVATGSAKAHELEQKTILSLAFAR